MNEEQKEKQRKIEQRKKRKKKLRRKRCFVITALLVVLIVLVAGIGWGLSKIGKQESKEAFKETKPIEIEIQEPEPEPIQASILTGGDVILHSPFITSKFYLNNGKYNYNDIFKYIKEEYASADYTVLNLESTIATSDYSGYPRFRAPAAIVTALKANAVDMCLLANNHIYDNHDDGVYMTLDALEANAMQYLGVRRDVESPKYFIEDINGIKVGIFNYVYSTGGSSVAINGLPVSDEVAPMLNTFSYNDLESFYQEVEEGLSEMEAAGVEYTIAYIHWGNEYKTTENQTQRNMSARLCELGIDALIGGHPHVIQPVDLMESSDGSHQMICVYSVGNHLSNQAKELMDSMPTGHTEDGLMVKLTLEKTNDGKVSLIGADFIPTWVYRKVSGSSPEYFIMPLNDASIIQEASSLNIERDYYESLERTNNIIGEGVTEVQSALPIVTDVK